MTMLTAIVGSIASKLPGRSNEDDDGPTGAAAVRTAVNEISDLQERTFDATLGEPDIISPDDQEYFNDPKVVVPVSDVPYHTDKQLVFDVPFGENDRGAYFITLLEVFDLDLDTMEQLEGETAPVKFVGGNVVLSWHELGLQENQEEDHPWEDIRDDTDKGVEDQDEDTEDTEVEDDSNVTVEEETISTDEDGGESEVEDA